MKDRVCVNCGEPIPDDRRSDAIFCCGKCGWTHRNRKKEEETREIRIIKRQLDLNRKIIKDLNERDKTDVSIEALELLGFDFDSCTKVDAIDRQNEVTTFRIYEFQITTNNSRCIIKMVNNENV